MKIPRFDYPLHPEEAGEGISLGWIYEGERETTYGMKKQVALRIRSATHSYPYRDQNGVEHERPFVLFLRVNLAGGPKARLVSLRERLLGRKLATQELEEMDFEEADGVPVRYEVTHHISNVTHRPFDRIDFLKRIADRPVEDVTFEKQDIIAEMEKRQADRFSA